MLALVLTNDSAQRVRLRTDYPIPSPSPGEVLIRVTLAGICATDLELTRGYMAFAGVLGHEFVGIVTAGPPELVGRRVVGDINCACGLCERYRHGLEKHCPRRTVLGIAGRDGAFAEFLTLPAANCHVVPDTIADEAAVFVEPLAAAAHVLDTLQHAGLTDGDGRVRPDVRIALIGTGRLGLLTAQVLATQPCRLDVIGRNPRTLALCRQWGLSTAAVREIADDPQHVAAYDAVVECSGSPDGLQLALKLCRPCGLIVLKSTYAGAQPVDLAPAVVNEIQIIGSRCGDFDRALHLLERGQVQVVPLVSKEYPLRDGIAALAAAAEPESIKVLLRP